MNGLKACVQERKLPGNEKEDVLEILDQIERGLMMFEHRIANMD